MVEINAKQCIGCGACVRDCIANALTLEAGRAVSSGSCLLCGHCVAVCPNRAVSIPEYGMADVEEYDREDFSLDSSRLLKAIKFRRSIRNYKPQTVEQEKLEAVIQAGRYTATARNSQGCRFIVVQKELPAFKELIWGELGRILDSSKPLSSDNNVPLTSSDGAEAFRSFYERRLADPKDDYLFRGAPAVLYIATDVPVDAGLAAQNMELMAVSLGLGMLYNGYLRAAASMFPSALEFLGAGEKPLAVCMLLGTPAVTYLRTAPRRKADVIFR